MRGDFDANRVYAPLANDGNGHVFTASPPTMPYENANLGYRGGKWGPLGKGI